MSSKPHVQRVTRPASHTSSKSHVQQATRPASHTSSKPHIQQVTRPASHTSSKSHVQQATRPASHTSSKSHVQQVTRPASHTSSESHVQQVTRPASHTSSESHVQRATRPASHTSSKSHVQRVTRPASHTSSKPHVQQATRPASHTSSKSHFCPVWVYHEWCNLLLFFPFLNSSFYCFSNLTSSICSLLLCKQNHNISGPPPFHSLSGTLIIQNFSKQDCMSFIQNNYNNYLIREVILGFSSGYTLSRKQSQVCHKGVANKTFPSFLINYILLYYQ